MTRQRIAALVAVALAAPAAHAGEDAHALLRHEIVAAAEDAKAQADAWRRWAEDFSSEMRASMHTMFSERLGATKVVKGAPYSAEVVTETNQALADGNVISRKTSGRVYRDAEGRTRQETTSEGRASSIRITDPVENRTYIVTPSLKRVTVIPRAVPRHEPHAAPMAIPRVVVRTSRDVERGEEREIKEVHVEVVRAGDALAPLPPMPPVPPGTPFGVPVPPAPPLPGALVMRFESTSKLGKGVTTSLPAKDFDGVNAEGRSTVWTIAAGEIGNRDPIRITSESWYSPELKVTVHSRYHDPRQGETIYRLAGIRRGNPPADLFKVPEGYDVRERGRREAPRAH